MAVPLITAIIADKISEKIDKKDEKQNLLEKASDASKNIKNVIDLLQTKHSTMISDMHNIEGFSELHNSLFFMSYYAQTKTEMNGVFEELINLDKFSSLTQIQKRELIFSFNIFTSQRIIPNLPEISFHVCNFIITFKNDNGFMNFCVIHIEPKRYEDSVIYKYAICIMNTDFVPAQPYVVITESDSDIFGSSTIQRIKYMPATLKPEHYDTIIELDQKVIKMMFSES
jgi:hypothetical protein